MPQLPPDDQPDTIQIGPVDSIPVFHEDDPRLEGERRRWARARAKAQAMQTTDELLVGLEDPDWRVRHETVTRLIGKARHDHRTLGTLLRLLREDRAWQVRDAVATRLHEFERDDVIPSLISATNDPHPDVRSSAQYALAQLGVASEPHTAEHMGARHQDSNRLVRHGERSRGAYSNNVADCQAGGKAT